MKRVCCASWSQWALQVQSCSENQAWFCGWIPFYPLFDNKHYENALRSCSHGGQWSFVTHPSAGEFQGWIYSLLCYMPAGEFQGWLGVTASTWVWGTERRADLWMNSGLQDSLKGTQTSRRDRLKLTGFSLTTSTYLSYLPPCWCYNNWCQSEWPESLSRSSLCF